MKLKLALTDTLLPSSRLHKVDERTGARIGLKLLKERRVRLPRKPSLFFHPTQMEEEEEEEAGA